MRTATAVKVTGHRSGRLVYVACPFCADRRGRPTVHVHGWPWDSVAPGTRLSHCSTFALKGGYRIVVPTGLALPAIPEVYSLG
jgi:hypothetical protein